MDEHYIVTAIPKGSDEPEPVHPGAMDYQQAVRLNSILYNKHHINTTIWTQEEWEDYTMERDADLFCDNCGAFLEDCGCGQC